MELVRDLVNTLAADLELQDLVTVAHRLADRFQG